MAFLTPQVHGIGCTLGELCLSVDEVAKINETIAANGWRFVLLDVRRPAKPVKRRASKPEVEEYRQPAAKKKRVAPETPPTEGPAVYLPPPTITEPLIAEPLKSPPVCESATATWKDSAVQLMAKLESHPMSKSFASPAPLDERVTHPMDLSTISRKLESNEYTHPFRWQNDVRLIFYNAFKTHAPEVPIWRQATELSVHFENLVKEEFSVNPYALFKRPAPKPVEPSPVLAPAPAAVEPAAAAVAAAVQQPTTDAQQEMITLDAAQLKALLMQAATSGSANVLNNATSPLLAASPAPAPRPPPRPRGRALQPLPPGVRVKEGLGVVYTSECAGTPLAVEFASTMPVSALPPPCPVPSTDNKQHVSPMLSAGQKRTAMARFKELDVVYRKAVLDLVTDELGIHSLLCAQDIRYVPEVEVLPPIKQRQFFVYLKALVNQQKMAQDSLHLPATLPRALPWKAEAAAPPPQQLPFSSEQPPPPAMPWLVSRGAANKAPSSSSSDSEEGPTSRRRESSGSSSSSESEESESEVRNPFAARPVAAAAPRPRPPPFLPPGSRFPPSAPSVIARTPVMPHPLGAMALHSPFAYAQPPAPQTAPRIGAFVPPSSFGTPGRGLGKQHPTPGGLGFWPRSAQPAAVPMPAPAAPNWGESCWGEWKAKVIQEQFVSQTRNVGAASERESRAEKAEAEI